MVRRTISMFKENLIRLCDHTVIAIRERIERTGSAPVSEETVLKAKAFIDKKVGEETLVQQFVIRSWRNWDIVKTRDVDFFRSHVDSLFPNIPFISLFIDPFRRLLLDQDESGTYLTRHEPYWDFVTALIESAIVDMHRIRDFGPSEKKPGKMVYRKRFLVDEPDMKGFDLRQMAERWKVPLMSA